jgi:hypothetical protein
LILAREETGKAVVHGCLVSIKPQPKKAGTHGFGRGALCWRRIVGYGFAQQITKTFIISYGRIQL